MEKETDLLWDDSALINAFDQALSKYKKMHIHVTRDDTFGVVKSTDSKNGYSIEENQDIVEPNSQMNDVVEATPIGCMTCNNNKTVNEPPVQETKQEEPFSSECNQELPGSTSTLERVDVLSEADYNGLLNQYYEIEEKRQQILQQLQQVNCWNYPPSTSYQVPQVHEGTSTSNLACQTCMPHDHCTVCALNHSSCDTSCPWDACKYLLHSHQISADEKHMENAEASVVDGSQPSQTNETETALSLVLSSWYSAGFYTGRYLLEQSMKKGSR